MMVLPVLQSKPSAGAGRELIENSRRGLNAGSSFFNRGARPPKPRVAHGLGQSLNRTRVSPKRFGNAFAHQGLQLDPEIGSYQNRARQYLSRLNRFGQPDPVGYPDGTNYYAYTRCNPTKSNDPLGFASCELVCADMTYGPHEAAKTKCCTDYVACACRVVTCYRDPSGITPPPSGCAQLCLEEHEKVHRDNHVVCGLYEDCDTNYVPPFAPDSNEAECPAYTAQLACLENCGAPYTPATDEELRFVKCMKCATCDPNNIRYDKPYQLKLSQCYTISHEPAGRDGCE